jgi:hypothetical protein
MSLPKYRARRDASEQSIIEGLEALGWECVRLSSGDLPDLLVRHRGSGQLILLEVENDTYKRYRSKAQKAMLAAWKIPIVRDFAEAALAVGAKIS